MLMVTHDQLSFGSSGCQADHTLHGRLVKLSQMSQAAILGFSVKRSKPLWHSRSSRGSYVLISFRAFTRAPDQMILYSDGLHCHALGAGYPRSGTGQFRVKYWRA